MTRNPICLAKSVLRRCLTKPGERLSGFWQLVAAVLLISIIEAQAQDVSQGPAAPSGPVPASQALHRQCGACHGRDRLKSNLPLLESIPDFMGRPGLVIPGAPDRSGVIWALLGRHPINEDGRLRKIAPNWRADLMTLRRWIRSLDGARRAQSQMVRPVSHKTLRIVSARAHYGVGDEMRFSVKTDKPCRLTVINIDPAGMATVVFPNGYSGSDLIDANGRMEVPARSAPYVFVARMPGAEIVVAMCAGQQGAPLGIQHDFDRQRFTALGNWEAFLQSGRQPVQLAPVPVRRRLVRYRKCRRVRVRGRKRTRCRWHRRRVRQLAAAPVVSPELPNLTAVSVIVVRVSER